MSVITISRGTFSGGKLLAECLSRRLGFRSIDRDTIAERAAGQRASRRELRAALEEPPRVLGRFTHKRYIYLTLLQAALAEEVRAGGAIYHGLAGHLLLGSAPGILRLRIIAPMDFRIRMRLRAGPQIRGRADYCECLGIWRDINQPIVRVLESHSPAGPIGKIRPVYRSGDLCVIDSESRGGRAWQPRQRRRPSRER